MRQISRIKVENFKSLVDFKIKLDHFTCLIGLNGAGKSTLLQFLDFLSQLVRGDMEGWLKERKWKSTDIKSKLSKKQYIYFCVWFVNKDGEPAGRWEGNYNPSLHRCVQERVDLLDYVIETKKDDITYITRTSYTSLSEHSLFSKDKNKSEITFDYEGSILSVLKEELLPESILECKKLFEDMKSLELLAPEKLRQRTRESAGTMGRGGQNLSAFLYEMDERKRHDLINQLKEVYQQLFGLRAKPLRSGWKQIEITEQYDDASGGFIPIMTTEARHINDGMLRLIAILAELQSDYEFLLFDEIENGINPELVEFVLNALVTSEKQIVVTTHSPMILNYLEDDTARKGVIYLYKTKRGHTKSIPFFSIPSLAEKLTVMGPGEAFVDTDLIALADEINDITEAE